MGFPDRSNAVAPLYLAPIVFVLAPDGEVVTIGGEEISTDDLGARGQDFAVEIRRIVGRHFPPGTLTSRIRPLMPRFPRPGKVTMPFWTTGRLPFATPWDRASGRLGEFRTDALERLARSLGDLSLVAEARSEFNRALAADPVSHQMTGESARLRALVMDELARQEIPDELPPILALLPEVFTIEQLHAAVQAAVHANGGETSSNFRRRLNELIKFGVLEPLHEREFAERRGRPAQLHRFDPAQWRRWLENHSASQDTVRSLDSRGMVVRQAMPDDAALRSQEPPSLRPDAYPPVVSRMVRPSPARMARSAPPMIANPAVGPIASPGPESAPRPQDDRVSKLEELVRHLASQMEQMSKANRRQK